MIVFASVFVVEPEGRIVEAFSLVAGYFVEDTQVNDVAVTKETLSQFFELVALFFTELFKVDSSQQVFVRLLLNAVAGQQMLETFALDSGRAFQIGHLIASETAH